MTGTNTSAQGYLVHELTHSVASLGSIGFASGIASVLGMSSVTLMPAWAVRVLHGDARTNGLLQSARGRGALAVPSLRKAE